MLCVGQRSSGAHGEEECIVLPPLTAGEPAAAGEMPGRAERGI